MSNSQKITRIHLSVNEQEKPVIFGIVTSDPDYKLSLKLNKKLGISLRNTDPVEFQDNEGNKFIFSKFDDSSAAPDSVLQLISNRSEKKFLLTKLKNVDYLLIINDRWKNFKPEQVMSHIREIELVTGVFNIEFKTLKDKNMRYLI
jgi:hypothetical protein